MFTQDRAVYRVAPAWAILVSALMRPLHALSVALLTFLLADGIAGPAGAQNAPPRTILQLGDAAVTGFSGVTAQRPPPGGVPADYFYINQDGASLVVFDLSRMQGPEDARLVNAPRKFSVQAKQIGQVVFDPIFSRTDRASLILPFANDAAANIRQQWDRCPEWNKRVARG